MRLRKVQCFGGLASHAQVAHSGMCTILGWTHLCFRKCRVTGRCSTSCGTHSWAEACIGQQGWIAIEWPRGCTYWESPQVLEYIERHELQTVTFDGCSLGLKSVVDGRPIRKPWRITTNSLCVVDVFGPYQRIHEPSQHIICGGQDTKLTANYPMKMASLVHQAFRELVQEFQDS